MAVGGVISNRNFGSFLGSGKSCKREQTIARHCRGYWVNAVARYKQGNSFYGTSISRYSYCPSLQIIGPSHGKTCSAEGCQGKWARHPLLFSKQFNGKLHGINPRGNTFGMCTCCPSPENNGQIWHSKHARATRHRVSYKSDEYDITEGGSLQSEKGTGEIAFVKENVQKLSPWWEQFPKRWVIVLLCFSAFLLCNMDRVNMSIAILPMSKEFNWNSATVGLIQSSFFWGYLLTQIVGGIWADKIGGKLVLGFGVVWWSIATILTPIAAKLGLPFLLVMRAFMGIGEGVAMPAMNNLLSKWIPLSERSRSLALVYSGMYLGSVAGLAFSPILIHKFGWPSVFYSFGSLGSIWFAMWLSKAHSSPREDPGLSEDEKQLILDGSTSREPVKVIPWKLILSKSPVWALIISHFCHNWGTFILLTWMPTYYNQVLKFNLTESGLLCVLPWLTMAVFANIGGWIADTLVSRGLSITTVRKARIDTDS